jgi:hypothetical protein
MRTTPTWYRKTDPARAEKWGRVVEKVRTEPGFEACRSYAGADRPEFAAWLAHVNRSIGWGVTFADLPDAELLDWYTDEVAPQDAAQMLTGGAEL